MCNRSTLDILLKEAYTGLKEIFGEKLESVILYGSYARGDYDSESDIDVMALVNLEKSDLARYRRTVSDLANDIDLKYDVLLSVKLQDKFTFEKYSTALPYYANVIKEGIYIGVQ
ncbi:MAG: nucleotidyltransferase domain-containing protein [Clostridia bacterium]|nr:nucleotidyltransferase domain-containing protein [Clostridia bacterium]